MSWAIINSSWTWACWKGALNDFQPMACYVRSPDHLLLTLLHPAMAPPSLPAGLPRRPQPDPVGEQGRWQGLHLRQGPAGKGWG